MNIHVARTPHFRTRFTHTCCQGQTGSLTVRPDTARCGACGPLVFQKGGIFSTTNKTLKVHSYHLIFHIKHSSGAHADRNSKDSIYWHTRINHVDMNRIGGYAIIKTRRSACK